MEHANPVTAPMDLNNTPEPNKDTATADQSNLYVQLLGELQTVSH